MTKFMAANIKGHIVLVHRQTNQWNYDHDHTSNTNPNLKWIVDLNLKDKTDMYHMCPK